MPVERTVEFECNGLTSTVDWQEGLPLPTAYLPRGSKIIEMPNSHHKGIAKGPIGELYHCIKQTDEYSWTSADDLH